MNSSKQIIANVPTNIITGFLGVGKTTAILHLLTHKPTNQRWAVLVNEFGEIGVDGSLLQGQVSEEHGVFIKEVPGGCMCCTAGVPMQVALNMLLSRAKPDRLLIEPTGIGHPIEVLRVLSEDHYRDVLSIQKVITLVDARKLTDSRYTNHDTFKQQIAIADILIGNKQDLYSIKDKDNLEVYAQKNGSPQVQVLFTTQGVFDFELLAGKTTSHHDHYHHHKHTHDSKPDLSDDAMPECGYLKACNSDEGYQSIGWRFSQNKVFDHFKLTTFLSSLNVERMKAVFITKKGIFGYNLTDDNTLLESELDDASESRIEIISMNILEYWDEILLSCLVNGA
ncbi:cobalamin biosynthesis protein P47K [Achromatium sp. WMS3]|nr:cobalamin biosynthesis protein P47K [Achromatium sp. WMS3]